MQGDDPPFLVVGTDVSAKYKGAFCEAKIKKVVRNIKCKVTLKGGGTTTVNDDVIKGTLRVGSNVEVKQDPKKDAIEAVITKIQDCSQYTVVFDDGDITTLRRSALCLKSGRHFNESETLDQLPLTHPEHFSTPVIAGRRGRRGRAQSDESEGEVTSTRRVKADSAEREPHVGRVVLVEAASGAERRRPHQPAFPALVVAPTPQIKVKEDYLVRSFKDGRYYTVPKKEAREFRKGSAPLEWAGVEAALQYLNNSVLPPHWDRDSLFNEPRNTSDDSSDDEPREEKDHFVAQLYKFMDDRGTPLNRNPTIANRDIDLYRLFRVVQKLGGYNRVTNQNQWKTIADKMGFHPVTTNITNLCKQAYKKFLHSFEDFYRKLGVTLVAHPRGARTPPAGRSLIRDRDKQPPAPAPPAPAPAPSPGTAPSTSTAVVPAAPAPTAASASPSPTPSAPSAPTPPPVPPPVAVPPPQRTRDKDSDKSETEKSDKSEKEDKIDKSEDKKKIEKEKPHASDGEDSADNQPLAVVTPKIEKTKESKEKDEKSKEKDKNSNDDKVSSIKPRSQSKSRSIPPAKTDSQEKKIVKKRPLSSKGETSSSSLRASRRPHVSTDSDSSGRVSRCGLTKKVQSRRSQSANSASSGNTIASTGSKRPRKRKITEPSTNEPTRSGGTNVKAQVGDKLKVYYGPTQSESKVTYEAKVIEVSAEGMLRVHYTGWNTRYDEWIKPQRIALNVTQHDARNKKGTGNSRRVRSKRTTEESSARSTDSDSDSDDDIKRSKKSEDKSTNKTPSRSKDTKSSDSSSSSKPRKRPVRNVPTPTNVSPLKKPRLASTGHQGRDYDLNEIRSELKGLHTVKQEAEEPIKQEVTEKDNITTSLQPIAPPTEPAQPDKQPEDVYEFKEPEPFEIELHDEKKKRSHRIFDDISPSKYSSTLSKSLSEEISEDPLRPRPSALRSPSLSPFRDFGATRDAPGRQSPEEDSKDGLFSLDDDSFPGEGSSGPIFEGFTPAKNQETYSKKNKVSKLRELMDDSPESPADDEQSSDDDTEDIVLKEEPREPSPVMPPVETPKPLEENKEEPKQVEPKEPLVTLSKETPDDAEPSPQRVEPPKSPLHINTEVSVTCNPTNSLSLVAAVKEVIKKEDDKEQVAIVSTDTSPPNIDEKIPPVISHDNNSKPEKTSDPEPKIYKLEPPSSPLIDTEEDKSEPDSPARLDVIPEPPPGFLLQSEGPKIAEKLLKAIKSAKRLSMSPPPVEEPPNTTKQDILTTNKPEIKSIKSEIKLSPVPPEIKITTAKDCAKIKIEPVKKFGQSEATDSVLGEPSNLSDSKPEYLDIKKAKTEGPTPPRLHSPLSILERRTSVADLPLSTIGKNNKVLSDTIQKLSSQINQAPITLVLPPFPSEDRSESSDSDDSDRRLIIDKLSVEEWGSGSCEPPVRVESAVAASRGGPHAGKSPGEWSAGESLLMLEDACKNERKHSASVVVAGSARASGPSAVAAASAGGEEDSNISLLLCEETIPGSPAPDAEPAPPRQRLHMPFASAPQHHHHPKDCAESRRATGPAGAGAAREGGGAGREGGGAGEAESGGAGGGVWGRRHALLDNTPPTTPDSSLDMSPHRERRISERDSPLERKEEEDDVRGNDASALDMDKPFRVRARKASECSGAGSGRGRGRRRRDTDEHMSHTTHHTPASSRYNFLIDLDPLWDSQTRINVLTSRMAELRKVYHSVKGELAAIDRRRKKLRRKEREAVKAAKAACS